MTRSDAPRSGARPLSGARGAAVEALRRLHGEIDAEAAAVAQNHADRLQCGRGCADCCVDDLEVFEVEASNIRLAHAELLANESPIPRVPALFSTQIGVVGSIASGPTSAAPRGFHCAGSKTPVSAERRSSAVTSAHGISKEHRL